MRSHPDSGGVAVPVAVAAALVLLAAAFLGAGAGILGQAAAACQAQPPASTAAATIPAAYLADYKKAGTHYGIPWTVLAGIGEVESGQGRSGAPGVHSGANPAGAAGPMQFGIGGLAGNTWGGAPVHPASEHAGGYGIDGDHDGIVNVYDPGDAIPSAAGFLKAHGAPGNLQAAIYAYNHSDGYVTDVLDQAARYAAGGTRVLAAEQGPACQQAARAAARRDRRESHRLHRSPARQALPVGRHRPGRVRLLRAHHDGLPRRRDQHPPHQPAAMGLRPSGARIPGPARRPRVLRRIGRHDGRPWPRRHRHRPQHDDRRALHRPGRARGKLQRQHRPGGLHPPLDDQRRRRCRFSIKMSLSQKTCPELVRSDIPLRRSAGRRAC